MGFTSKTRRAGDIATKIKERKFRKKKGVT
jgi:hypothetical protein